MQQLYGCDIRIANFLVATNIALRRSILSLTFSKKKRSEKMKLRSFQFPIYSTVAIVLLWYNYILETLILKYELICLIFLPPIREGGFSPFLHLADVFLLLILGRARRVKHNSCRLYPEQNKQKLLPGLVRGEYTTSPCCIHRKLLFHLAPPPSSRRD